MSFFSFLAPDNVDRIVGDFAYRRLGLSNKRNPLRWLPILRKWVRRNENRVKIIREESK